MKLIKYEAGGKPSLGIANDGEIAELSGESETMSEVLSSIHGRGSLDSTRKGLKINNPDIRPPLDEGSKILCVAANYYSHIKEMNMTPPKEPVIFSKYHSTLIGPYQPIVTPAISSFIDYEGELAVVIGKEGRNISRKDAWQHVAGFTVINDVSARDLLRVTLGANTIFDWFSCKAIDSTSPVGPWIVTKDEIADPQQLRVVTELNGETVQNEQISGMVFPIEELVEYISRRVTLNPGDMIATGTPSGVGATRKRNLRRGDVVKVSIQGVGFIENRVA